MALTLKQKAVFDFIQSYSLQYALAPTQREIRDHFGLKSFGSVQRYIRYLIEQGLLTRDWNARRGLVAVAMPERSITLPILGKVAAGKPIEALEYERSLPCPPDLIGSGEHFALTVVGHSMIDDGIFDQDTLIVRAQKTANHGQTIVATLDGEATVKRFIPKAEHIELHPANAQFAPIIVGDQNNNFEIKGIVVGLIRRYRSS